MSYNLPFYCTLLIDNQYLKPFENSLDSYNNNKFMIRYSNLQCCTAPVRHTSARRGGIVTRSGAGLTCVGSTVSRPRGIDILLAAPPAAPRRPPAPHHPPTRHYGPRARSPAPTDAHHKQEKHFPDNAIFHDFTGFQHLSFDVSRGQFHTSRINPHSYKVTLINRYNKFVAYV